MLRFNNAGKVFVTVLGISALAAGFVLLRRYVSGDPFKAYKDASNDIGNLGMQFKDVDMKHFEGTKLVASAHVDRIDVDKSHNSLDMFGIKNGIFATDKGDFKFAAGQANFDSIGKRLNVESGGRFANKDMDLSTSDFVFNQHEQKLEMPGTLSGKFMGGTLVGQNLNYDFAKDKYSLKDVKWKGQIQDKSVQEIAGKPKSNKTIWELEGDMEGVTKDREIYNHATATDHQIYLKADHIEREIKTDIITCTGKVYYFGDEANLVCDKAVIYRKEKRAVLTGDVRMLVKPKDKQGLDITQEVPPFKPVVPGAIASQRPPAPTSEMSQQEKDLDDELHQSKTIRKYPMKVRADQIVYWYTKGSRRADITGTPFAHQELTASRWRDVTCYKAFYDGEAETLKLMSQEGKFDTVMKNSKGEIGTTDWFLFSTKDDEDSYDEFKGGHVRMQNVQVDDDEDPRKDKAGGGSTGGDARGG